MMPRVAAVAACLVTLLSPASPCHAAGDTDARETGPDAASLALGRRATQWSVAATALPLAMGGLIMGRSVRGSEQAGGAILVTAGLVFGPITGFSVGGQPGRGWSGAALRTAVAVGGLGMTLAAVGQAFNSDSDTAAPVWILGGTAAALLGLAGYDVATVGGYVTRSAPGATGAAIEPALEFRHGGPALAVHARF